MKKKATNKARKLVILSTMKNSIAKLRRQVDQQQRFTMYQEWISQQGCVTGRCLEVCRAMHEVFPELKLVRGFYYCHVTGKTYPHWWLETQLAIIVDPTAKQFMSSVMGDYVRIDESKPEPTGICCNCGNPCYNNALLCSKKCTTEYAAFCMNGGA